MQALDTENFFSEYCKCKSNLECNYFFPIDLAPNEILVWNQINLKSLITIEIRCDFGKFRFTMRQLNARVREMPQYIRWLPLKIIFKIFEYKFSKNEKFVAFD